MTTKTATAPAARRTPARRRRRAIRKGPSILLTSAGMDGLAAYVARLREELTAMREWLGDPRRDERLVLDAERLIADIDSYEGLLAQAEAMDEDAVAASTTIMLGSWVSLTFDDGGHEVVRLVHPSEAFLDEERVSIEAPLALALLGLSAGDTALVKAPAGRIRVRVDAVGAEVVGAMSTAAR